MSAKVKQETKKVRFSGREKALVCVSVLCAVVAIAAIVFNFVKAVPSDAAAKVNDSYLSEQRVSDWISEYRGTYGLTDDTDFADSLSSQSLSVTSFRINVINELATNDLVQKRASELGITVTDDEVQAQYDTVIGSVSSGDSSLFLSTIQSMGLTEQSLKNRYRNNLLEEKVLEADVPVATPSDSDVVSYISSTLSGTTQMHVYRVVINGSDKETRLQECRSALEAEKAAGTLNAEKFAEIAKKYSDEENVATTGGSLGWTGSGVIPSELTDFLDDDISVGDLTGTVTVEEDDGAYEIAYVDSSYTFPDSVSSSATLSSLNIPSELSDAVVSAVSYSNWETDCNTYLNNMLSKASITYYPIPSNASYNVSAE